MAKNYKKNYTPKSKEEKQAVIDDLFKQIQVGIEDLSQPSHFMDLWKFQAQFHKYSFNNQVLIKEQYPTAKQVSSFAKWKELGYSVNKGEKGIKILAPRPYEVFINEKDETKFVNQATEKEKELLKLGLLEKKKILKFIDVTVFDIQQTNATKEDYPKLMRWLPIGGDHHEEMLNAMVDYCKEKYNLSISYVSNTAANGMYFKNYDGSHAIALKKENGFNQQLLTLMHELGHFKLKHLDENRHLPRHVMEMEAESVAFITTHQFGIDEKREQTEVYISSWLQQEQGDIESRLELMKASFNRINHVCVELMDDIEYVYENFMNHVQESETTVTHEIEMEL